MKKTWIWIGLMIVLFTTSVLYLSSIKREEMDTMCALTMPESLPENTNIESWDLSNINPLLNTFPLGSVDTNDRIQTSNLIQYLVKNNVAYATYIKKGKTTDIVGTDFPPLGQGLCRKDTGHRGVFFNDKHKLDAMEIDATPNGYQTCKDRANKLGATVFSLQFKHGANKAECWIGDNPGVSVGMNRNDDGFRHDETNICGLYGGPWSQNVYIKQPPKKYIEPDTTIYYFKDDDVKKFIKNLLDQGYTDIMDALCRNKEDSTLHL